MGVFRLSLFSFIFLLFGQHTLARVFVIKEEKFSSYFLLQGGPSEIKKTFFEGENSISTATYSTGFNLNSGFEFGFMWASDFLNLRFGVEILRPSSLTGVKVENSGSLLYTMNSELTGFVPKVGLEANMQVTQASRSYAFFTYGSASITAQNSYELTAAGLAAFPGVVDHVLKMKGSADQLAAGLGFERHLSDSSTYMFQLGYQQLQFNKLKSDGTVTTFNGQVYGPGDEVLFTDGKNRSLNFNGAYLSLGVRVYID